jgi:hypothetical protein
MEISDIRRRLRLTIDRAKRTTTERRARADAAGRAYQAFLTGVATPVLQMFASALKAEGYAFQVFTPAGGLRLMSERGSADFVELALDPTTDPPSVLARINRGRGSRVITAERTLGGDAPIEQITQEDVLAFLLAEIEPFVER